MGNLIFSRRCLQERLNSLQGVIPREAQVKLAERLNEPGRDRLSAMWEVAWLAALGGARPIDHEEALPNGARPDFAFDLSVNDGSSVRIVGDVTSASDQGLDDRNPVKQFWREVCRLAHKHQLSANHFRYDIGHQMVGKYGDRRIEVSLPPLKELSRYLKEKVEPFIKSLRRSGEATGRLVCDDPGVSFTLTYNTSQEFGGGGYASYNVAYSPTKNPLFTALEKKASQLSDAPTDSIRVVILCDGGCHAMQPSLLFGGGSMSAGEVVRDYLRKSSSIDVVLLVTVVTEHPTEVWRRYRRIDATFVAPTDGVPGSRLSGERVASLRAVFAQALEHLPQPKIDATNAAIRMDHASYGNALHGASKMSSGRSGETVRVSARAVLELLAGSITFDEFQELHRWDEHDMGPFVRSIKDGALIRSAALVDGGNEDDDWLELRFGDDPDPAVSPFRPGPA